MCDYKKEITNPPPRQRSCRTYQQTFSFHETPQPMKQIQSPSRISNIFPDECSVNTPQKIRINPTNSSLVFSPDKFVSSEKRIGLKTFVAQQTLYNKEPQPERQYLPSPFKQLDHPRDDFHNVDQQITLQKQSIPLHHYQQQNQKNLYFDKNKDNKSPMTIEQKLYADLQSDIFMQKNNQDLYSPNHKDKQLNTLIKWDNPFYGKLLTQVNEQACFGQDYSKSKKLEEFQSSVLPCQKVDFQIQQQSKTETNEHIKRNNQNFSDLFDQEYGSKIAIRKKVRSISPHFQWQQFDSVRNSRDVNDSGILSIKANDWISGQKSVLDTHQYNGSQQPRLSQNHIICAINLQSMKGLQPKFEQSPQPNGLGASKYSTQYESFYKASQNETGVYKGLYGWKSNYKKKK